MSYTPPNPNGQATSANSAPSVLSKEQSPSVLAQDDSIVLLSRILKTLESLSIIDSGQRQRITLDAISAALTLATVTTVSTVTTVTNQSQVAGMDRELYINQARVAYNTGIRTKLS